MHQLSIFLFRSVLGAALLFGAVASSEAALSVGAARVDITPPADPANPPSGKYEHEQLFVRAIVLDNGSARAALIGADQSGLSEQAWTLASRLRLKKESPLANTVVVTLANGRANSGYIPNDTAFGAYTFQVLGSRLKPGYAETGIVDGLLDLIDKTRR